MSPIPLECLDLEPMASGDQSLRLSTQVTWQAFPSYARDLIAHLNGTITSRADSPVERVWTVLIRGELFWIAFDDFALGISLDPQSEAASQLIPKIRTFLLQLRDSCAS